VVDEGVWRRFPGLRIVLVWAAEIDNRSERPGVAGELARAINTLQADWSLPNPQSHPRIAAWREAIRATGFSGKKFPSSIEALTRRVVGGKGLGSINPLVDFYNAVSLTHLVPAGGWDLDTLAADGEAELRLCLAAGGERFRALGADEAVAVEPGEAAYVVGDQVVTRHFVWRQSDLGKLTPDTRRALLISECLREVPDSIAQEVASAFADGLSRHFGVRAQTSVVSESSGDQDSPC